MHKHVPRAASPVLEPKSPSRTSTPKPSTPKPESNGHSHGAAKLPRPSSATSLAGALGKRLPRKSWKRFRGSGTAAMLAATFSFFAMSVAIKSLSPEWKSYEVIAVRSVAALLYCFWASGFHSTENAVTGGLWARDPKAKGWTAPTDLQLKLMLRGLLGFSSLWMQCLSLERLSVGESTTLQFLYPLITVVAAAAILGETYTAFDVVMSALGFVGCMMVVLPKTGPPGDGAEHSAGDALVGVAAGVGSAVFQALSFISVRQITKQAHGLQLLWYFSAVCLPCAALARMVFAPVAFSELYYFPTSFKQAWWLFVTCATGISGQVALSAALRTEKVGDAASLSYLQVPLAFIADYAVFHVPSGLLGASGALLITAAGLAPSFPFKEKFNRWFAATFYESAERERE
ncbi:hypothetical protein DFJ74DRAFT_656194 [Hyaloraphidium curvatum]|nr:hypothetical protein DFJ74DRAFT_656194 [Hyaloraphidium curvatum]